MADYLALIASLNSDSPTNGSMASPEDFSAELSLWTNAEFTFDTAPGLGIFESDSAFPDLLSTNTASTTIAPPVVDPTPAPAANFNSLDIMNFTGMRAHMKKSQQQTLPALFLFICLFVWALLDSAQLQLPLELELV